MTSDVDELAEVEARVAHRRRELEQAVSTWVQQRQEAVASPKGLLGAVAAGVVVGIVLRGRKRPAPASRSRGRAAPAAPATNRLQGLLMGLAMSLIRMRYGTPWNAFESIVLQRRRVRHPPSGGLQGQQQAAVPGGSPGSPLPH